MLFKKNPYVTFEIVFVPILTIFKQLLHLHHYTNIALLNTEFALWI